MIQPAYHVLDTVVVVGSTLATASSAVLLVGNAEAMLLVLPLLGGVLMGGGFILLNPSPDTRQVTIGRAIVGLFCGVLVPQLIGLFHPSLNVLMVKPVVLVATGGAITALVYGIIKAFSRKFFARADGVGEALYATLENRYLPKATMPICPACHENAQVIFSPPESRSRGFFFCPCNQPGPNPSGHFNP